MRNERLWNAVVSAGLDMTTLSEVVQVDRKTIERWVTSGRVPHRANQLRIASALGVETAYLWPDGLSDSRTHAASNNEVVQVFANRASVPGQLWESLISGAQQQVDVLAFAASFMQDAISNFQEIVTERAEAGTQIRLLLGDPSSAAVALRGDEEGIGDSLADRCRLSWKYMQPLLTVANVEAKMHGSTLYASMFRFDNDLLLNHHLFGAAASHSSVTHLRRVDGGRLFTSAVASFERVWDAAQAVTTGALS